MKKLFAIFTATLVICGLCVAPAYATPYYPTDVTDIDALIPIPSYMDDTAPVIEFETPDAPGDYEFHLYGPWLGEDDQPLPCDKELTFDDGSGAYLAYAEHEYEAVSMVEQYITDNQSEDKQFSEITSGTYEAVTETEWVVDQEGTPAWCERIEHAAETHTEVVTKEVNEGWAKCDKDGQSSYGFTGDKLIIHDGQTGYWFWSAQPMDNWKEFAASTGINKANQVAYARSGYGVFNSKQTDETKRIIGGKTFTIEPGKISADGGISWVAWEHFKTIEVGTRTVVDKEEWIEYIEHPAVLESGHYETKVIEPAVGWANVTWKLNNWCPIGPEDFDDPVNPEEPNNDGPNPSPIGPEPEPTPVVPTNVVVPDAPEQVAEVTIANTVNPVGQSVLPKTGDHLGYMDSIIAIITAICLAVLFMELCRRFDKEE